MGIELYRIIIYSHYRVTPVAIRPKPQGHVLITHYVHVSSAKQLPVYDTPRIARRHRPTYFVIITITNFKCKTRVFV